MTQQHHHSLLDTNRPIQGFSDAGMTMASTRCGRRRPRSAKARNRGRWGTGGAAGYGDSAAVRDLSAG